MFFNWFKKEKTATKNWPHQLIKFLYDSYAEAPTSLNMYVYDHWGMKPDNTTHKDNLKTLLDTLHDAGYLTWKVIKVEGDGKYDKWIKDNYQHQFKTEPGLVLLNHRVEAMLTIKGLDYAIELEREKQQHAAYMISTPTSLVFAALAFLISLFTFIRGCSCNQKKEKELPSINIRIESKDTAPRIDTPLTPPDARRSLPAVSTNPIDTAQPVNPKTSTKGTGTKKANEKR